jgi:hypothetical protein
VPEGYDPDLDPNVLYIRCTARLCHGSREYNTALQHLEAALLLSVRGAPPSSRQERLRHLVHAIGHEGRSARLSHAAGCLPHRDPRRHDAAMRAAGLAAFAVQREAPQQQSAAPHESQQRSLAAAYNWSVSLR